MGWRYRLKTVTLCVCVEIEEDVENEKALGGLDEGELVEDDAIRVVEEGDH